MNRKFLHFALLSNLLYHKSTAFSKQIKKKFFWGILKKIKAAYFFLFLIKNELMKKNSFGNKSSDKYILARHYVSKKQMLSLGVRGEQFCFD